MDKQMTQLIAVCEDCGGATDLGTAPADQVEAEAVKALRGLRCLRCGSTRVMIRATAPNGRVAVYIR